MRRKTHLSDACFVSFSVQKNVSAFFSLFFVFWSLLSFFLSFITTRKRSFFAPLCAPRVYSFAAALSPLCEKKRAFHVLKEEEEQSFVDRRVRVIGKAALFFLKTGETKKERSFRENSIEISKIKSSLESSSSSSWGNKRNISDRTKSTGYSKTSR